MGLRRGREAYTSAYGSTASSVSTYGGRSTGRAWSRWARVPIRGNRVIDQSVPVQAGVLLGAGLLGTQTGTGPGLLRLLSTGRARGIRGTNHGCPASKVHDLLLLWLLLLPLRLRHRLERDSWGLLLAALLGHGSLPDELVFCNDGVLFSGQRLGNGLF